MLRPPLNQSYDANLKCIFAFLVVKGQRDIMSTVPSSHLFTNLSALQPAWHVMLTQQRPSGVWGEQEEAGSTPAGHQRQKRKKQDNTTFKCGICSTGEGRAHLSLFNDSLNPYNSYLKNTLVAIFKHGFGLGCRGWTVETERFTWPKTFSLS